MNPKLKNILILLLIATALFFVYRYFFVSEKAPTLVRESSPVTENQRGREFLSALLALQSINFDQSGGVFSDRAFVTLKDQSVSIPDEPVGRINPFLEIGDDSNLSPTGASASGTEVSLPGGGIPGVR